MTETTLDYFALAATQDPDAPGDRATAGLTPGADVDGYYVEAHLAEGGQASLYAVRRQGHQHVMKVYHEGFQPLAEVVRLVSRNESEYLAALAGHGLHQGRYFEVYARYDTSLDTETPRAGFVDKVVLPALDQALAYLHSRGLVHGDVKPANVFLTSGRDRAVLGDFGVATTLEKRGAKRMRFRGTPEYAPFAYRQGDYISIDPAYDYGALGLTLVKAYTGQSLFAGLSQSERDARWLAPLDLPPGIPLKARDLVLGLLERDPARRFGHQEVERYYSDRPRATGRWEGIGRGSADKRPKLEWGFFDGRPVVVTSLTELDRAIADHWAGGLDRLDSNKLRLFLNTFEAGPAAWAESRPLSGREEPDARLYRLSLALRRIIPGPVNTAIDYRSLHHTDPAAFIRSLDPDNPGDAGAFALDGSLVRHLEFAGFDAAATEACRAAIGSAHGHAGVALRLLLAIFGRADDQVTVGGVPVTGVDDLLRRLPDVPWSEVVRLAADDSFLVWLYRQGHGSVVERIRQVR